MGPEASFKKKVVGFLKELPNTFFFSTQERAIRGIPDIIASISGNFVALELKAENGSPTKLQLYTLERIRKSYGYAFLVYPSTFDNTKKILYLLTKKGGENGIK